MTVFTIGYEGLDVESFISLLTKHRVGTVVDVRELPLSRKPGFSKRSLSDNLRSAGLDYVHMVSLGCPRSVRNRYKEDGSWTRYTEGFLRHLNGQAEAVVELAERASESNCALLCFEADYRFCHRTFVANAVHDQSGAVVQHISAKGAKTAHLARSVLEPA